MMDRTNLTEQHDNTHADLATKETDLISAYNNAMAELTETMVEQESFAASMVAERSAE